MASTTLYRPHKVIGEARPDGSLLLRSGYEMSRPAGTTGCWLIRWASRSPDAVFLAERSGAGWRELRYGAALDEVRALAAALLDRGLGPKTPILILSGNSVDHGLLTLAAQYVGIPTVPLAEQYSLIPAAQKQLRHVLALIDPRMVFAEDGARFASALALDEMTGREIVVARNPGDHFTSLDALRRHATGDVDVAHDAVGPDSVVKILMTSGSTSSPKGVLTTHRMMCVNQAQLADALPFLRDRPPRIVDWLPWNHVFGGSHNFNMMLANGGALYIDAGKPAPGLMDTSLENNRLIGGTLAFNVPVGFARLRDAMREDAALRHSYFRDLDMIFYAGASLPQDVFADLAAMAQEVQGRVPLVNSSWGLTETAPACAIQHEPTDRSGIVGVPMTGVELKLLPDETDTTRYEIRVRGPNVMTGYYRDPERTAEAFDDEGFFRTGDAMRLVDPSDLSRGLKFDGRISEDFKLLTGTWVRAAQLRLDLLVHLAGIAQDVVITGADRREVGLMVVPVPSVTGENRDGLLDAPEIADQLARRLVDWGHRHSGSSMRVARALILAEPPSVAEGEITAKGNLNFRRLLTRRADLLDRLYSDDAEPVIRIPHQD